MQHDKLFFLVALTIPLLLAPSSLHVKHQAFGKTLTVNATPSNLTSANLTAGITAIICTDGNTTLTYADLQHGRTCPSAPMVTYHDPESRFSLMYPSSWTAIGATNKYETNALRINDGIIPTVIVIISRSNVSLQTFATTTQNGMYLYTVFQPTECLKYKVQGNTACSFIMTRPADPNLNTQGVVVLMVQTAINDKIYSIALSAPSDSFDSKIPLFDKIINSFHIGVSNG